MYKAFLPWVMALWLGGAVFGTGTAFAASGEVTVFAAASATNALTEIASMYAKGGKGKVALSFGSSSTLARQIEQGAPAHIFLSANKAWMDYLAERKLLVSGSRKDLLGNAIVVIAPAGSKATLAGDAAQWKLDALLGKDGFLALGDPAHVPVGAYAKAALQHLQLWQQVEKRLAPAKDVRAGLALVERGEALLGIVYASDAVITNKVKVIGSFPAGSHPEVAYPVALLGSQKNANAEDFMQFMASPEAAAVWAKYGFTVK